MSMALSRKQRARLVPWVALGTVLLGSTWCVKPLWEGYQDVASQLQDAQSHLPPDKLAAIGRTKRELVVARRDLAARQQDLPVAENVSTMLVELAALSKSKGALITHFFPVATGTVPFLAPVPPPPKAASHRAFADAAEPQVWEQQVELHADGDYRALRGLLAGLEQYHHPVSVRTIDFVHQTDAQATTSLATDPPMTFNITMAAYLLNHAPPQSSPYGGDFEHLLDQAQQKSGVANPFLKLIDLFVPPQFAHVMPVPPAVPRVAAADGLGSWQVVGILSGDTAVVTDGGESRTVRAGELLAGWTVDRVTATGVLLRLGHQSRWLRLPADAPI